MKYILFIILFLSSICYGLDQEYISYSYFISDYQLDYFKSYPITFFHGKYINDLGHEFPFESFVCGTYWRGGAWGNNNGYSNYYGNVYHNFYYNYEDIHLESIPEPNSFVLFTFLTFIFRKKLLKSD